MLMPARPPAPPHLTKPEAPTVGAGSEDGGQNKEGPGRGVLVSLFQLHQEHPKFWILLSHFLYNSNTEVLLRDMQHSGYSHEL